MNKQKKPELKVVPDIKTSLIKLKYNSKYPIDLISGIFIGINFFKIIKTSNLENQQEENKLREILFKEFTKDVWVFKIIKNDLYIFYKGSSKDFGEYVSVKEQIIIKDYLNSIPEKALEYLNIPN